MIQAASSATVMQRPAAIVAERSARQAAATAAYAGTDEVELSHTAQSQVGEDAPIREDLVRRVKAEIGDGSYMTDAKLDTVIDRLHRELFGG